MPGLVTNLVGPSMTVAGITMTDLPNLIVLHAKLDTNTNYASLHKVNGSGGSGYTPSGSKKFVCWAGVLTNSQAEGATGELTWSKLMYGDTAVDDSATAPTNEVDFGAPGSSGTGNARLATLHSGSSESNVQAEVNLGFFECPNGKYLSIRMLSSGSCVGAVRIYGYEV